jgi:hypothetical protein
MILGWNDFNWVADYGEAYNTRITDANYDSFPSFYLNVVFKTFLIFLLTCISMKVECKILNVKCKS